MVVPGGGGVQPSDEGERRGKRMKQKKQKEVAVMVATAGDKGICTCRCRYVVLYKFKRQASED